MAYFVAKTLKFRPMEILTTWTCEELLVAFAYYANENSKQNYEMMDNKERAKKGLTEIDRWVVPFVSAEQLEAMNGERERSKQDLDDQASIAATLFG